MLEREGFKCSLSKNDLVELTLLYGARLCSILLFLDDIKKVIFIVQELVHRLVV